MRSSGVLAGILAMVGGLVVGTASGAEAQAREALSLSSAPALKAPVDAVKDDRQEERDPTPMGFAGIGVKVGIAGMGAGQYTLKSDQQSYTGRLGKRQGLHLAIPIHLGGSGFGWTFEPFLDRSSMAYDVTNAAGVATDTDKSDLTAYGLYTGPSVNVQVIRPLYLGIGIGLKAAYVKSDAFDIAIDAYGRMPLYATYYVTDQLAVVTELGLGYGLSVLADRSVNVMMNAATKSAEKVGNDPQFGRAFAWDFSVGVRLP